MLMPKRTKFRKQQRGRMKGKATRAIRLDFGDYGLFALEPGRISNRQIESARVTMSRHMKRGGKIYLRIFPDIPFTKKPTETRMGKGKGNPEGWFCKVQPGRIMFELAGVSEDIAREALRRASFKLPIHCKFLSKEIL